MSGPLDGLRVVDFSGMLSGWFATMTLADSGADVVTVEHPDHGNPIRDWAPKDQCVSPRWKSLARNKRSVTLGLSTDEGRALAFELVEDADLVFENFRPGTLERWDLGYGSLHDVNEVVVLVRISGYGHAGPTAEQPWFGTAAGAISGFALVNGFPVREPLLPPISLADTCAAHYAVQSALFALFERFTGGEGQVVDGSLYEPLFRMFPGDGGKYDRLGEVSERQGNYHANAAPLNVYRAKDGHVAMSASSQGTFRNLCAVVGHPGLLEDDRFATDDARVEHADELDEYIAPFVAERTVEEAVADLTEADAVVAAGETVPACEAVLRALGESVVERKAVLGAAAVTHESGIHTDAMLDEPSAFEPFDPAAFDGDRRLVFGPDTGRGAARKLLQRAGRDADGETVAALLDRLAADGPLGLSGALDAAVDV